MAGGGWVARVVARTQCLCPRVVCARPCLCCVAVGVPDRFTAVVRSAFPLLQFCVPRSAARFSVLKGASHSPRLDTRRSRGAERRELLATGPHGEKPGCK